MIEAIKKALNYIIERNQDYEETFENEYLIAEYLGNENHNYLITINGLLYEVGAFTTISDAQEILNLINNGEEITYIYDTTSGFDTVVGDVCDFVNNIRDDLVAEYEYYNAVVDYFRGVFDYNTMEDYIKNVKKG